MNAWEVAILKAYDVVGGCADNQNIYDSVGQFIHLTNEHKKPTVYDGKPAYVRQVRSHIANLMQRGELENVSRGRYRLTPKGKKRL